MKTSKLTLVCDIYELINKDGKNIQKLAREIEEGRGVAEKFRNRIFKKSSYNASTILLAKITYKYQSREETLSLLHYAISHKNNQAVKDLLEEAKKQKLLKEVLNEEMTTKYSDGREETHTILTDAISRRDNDIMRAVLKISEKNGILKDILKKRIIIKHSNGKEMTHTPFTYAEVCENSEAVRELGNILNKRATQRSTVVTAETTTAKSEKVLQDTIGNIETPANACEMITEVCSFDVEHKPVIDTDTRLYEDVNKSSEGLQPIYENSEEAQIETTVEPNVPDNPSSTACFDSEGNAVKAIQPIVAGIVGAVLLVGSVVFYTLKIDVTVAVVMGIVGLACVSYALYSVLKPNTKIEEVENVEQPIQSSLNLT